MYARPIAAACAAFCLLAPASRADYVMPPMETVLRTAPLVIDATVTRAEPKGGAVHVKIHRVFRGALDVKGPLLIKHTSLTCTPGGPAVWGAKVGKRYVFLLSAEDALYETSTMFEVFGDPKKPDSLQVQHPLRRTAKEKHTISLAGFRKLIVPAKGS